MTLDADLIVDNRRTRRKLTFWRAATVLVLIAAFLAIGSAMTKQGLLGSRSAPHVARVNVTGMIQYEPKMIELLKRVEDNDAAKAVLVYIDSPGGSTAGSEALYNSLRRISAKKPVVAQIGALGASGAYVTALGTDHIIATKTSLVGSIGVLVQWAEFDKLIDNWGIRFQEVKTSPLKASPNGFEPASPEAKAALKALVDDSFIWFRDLVAERRTLTDSELKAVADGRVFTGRQSLDLKLIDEIGDEQSAKNWLINAKKIDSKLPLELYKVEDQRLPNWLGAAARLAGLFGFSASWLSDVQVSSSRLDGLVSVWQP
ncbi:MAG: signal peptide peptidase SppA [Pseudomonadota bacterium]